MSEEFKRVGRDLFKILVKVCVILLLFNESSISCDCVDMMMCLGVVESCCVAYSMRESASVSGDI